MHRCKAVGLLGGKEKSPPLLSSQESSVGYYRMRAEEHRQLTFVAQQFSMRCSRGFRIHSKVVLLELVSLVGYHGSTPKRF